MGDHMGTKATKIIMSILALSFMCLFLVACGEKKQPQYILMSAEDNGLVESYRAYFELDGNKVQSMKEMRFDAVIDFKAPDRNAVWQQVCAAAQEAYPDYQITVAMDSDTAD